LPLVKSAAANDARAFPNENGSRQGENKSTMTENLDSSVPPLSLALVGMAGCFPGADNVRDFWQNLINGVTSIRTFSNEELIANGVSAHLLDDPNYVKAGTTLKDIDSFDASFFGYSPREAEKMDPQSRLFLQCAWEALEDAGYDPQTYKAPIGIFAGKGFPAYMINNVLPYPTVKDMLDNWQVTISNERDSLASTVAYKLDLRGPSVSVQTFCSTSMVAIHIACQSLLAYECDIALAGGVAIAIPQGTGYLFQEGSILSPDGECRALDESANGSVMGNGLGIVVLKRLEDALQDGDHIYTIIRGSAMNNDGITRVGYAAPGLNGQATVIATALTNADIAPKTVSYVETHGTGTQLGDSIELAAMIKAFGKSGTNYCAIGSVKPNVGHMDRASGVTGLIKTALAMHYGLLPPSLYFKKPNAEVDLVNSPFYVNAELAKWQTNGPWPRRAGVSSFGLGGTNVHMVLEEAPHQTSTSESRPYQMLLLSAKTESALEIMTTNLMAFLQNNPACQLADVAYTLQVGRAQFNHRRLAVCSDSDDAADALALANPRRLFTAHQTYVDRPVVFMFAGVGNQYVGMAQKLYQTEPVFRTWVDRCCELLPPVPNLDLLQVLYPKDREENAMVLGPAVDLRHMLGRNQSLELEDSSNALQQTTVAQLAVFIIDYALAQLLKQWGIEPKALIGYSLGEYVAACLAGVLSLEDALTLVAKRAQMIQALPGGAMLAVSLPADQTAEHIIQTDLSLAAVNGERMCVVSGPKTTVAQLEEKLMAQGVACRQLATTHAFHSPMMAPIVADLEELVGSFQLNPPSIPYISNVTGSWITDEQAVDPAYWATHLRQPVQFFAGLTELLQDQDQLLLEVGPGNALSSIAKLHPGCHHEQGQLVLTTLRQSYENYSDSAFLLTTLGKMWLAGVEIDWAGFYQDENRRRVSLPTYPFEKQRYWVNPTKMRPQSNNGLIPQVEVLEPTTIDDFLKAELPRIPDITNWFYTTSWQRTPPHPKATNETVQRQRHCWLIFADESGIGDKITARLQANQQNVTIVRPGNHFAQVGEHEYVLRPKSTDYEDLLRTLRTQERLPTKIVHLWATDPIEDNLILTPDEVDKTLAKGFYSLLFLVQALGNTLTHNCQIAIISSDMQDVTDTTRLNPAKATILGPYKVVPQELTNLSCCSIDITIPPANSEQEVILIDQLVSELILDLPKEVLAFRGSSRWLQTFQPTPLTADNGHAQRLREKGVYLITGGLGGIGLAMAKYLVEQVNANIVLLSRSGLPPRDEWENILTIEGVEDGIGYRIHQVQELEKMGAEVLILSADVANESQMKSAIHQTLDRFGILHGVIHAAGMLAQGLTLLKDLDMVEKVLAAKIEGTIILHQALADIDLDFLVLISSMSSATGGGPGQIDYCAANAFLDSFARRYADHHGITISTGWGEWQWDAWQEGLEGFPEMIRELFKAKRRQFGISFAEGCEALRRILTHQLPHLIVSTQEFNEIMKGSKEYSTDTILSGQRQGQTGQAKYPRPTLGVPYTAPSSELESKIANVWSDLLGIEQVGIHDNFFDLGGNSLFGTDMIMRLRRETGAENIPLYMLYEAPTVSEMSKFLNNSQQKSDFITQQRIRGQERRQRQRKRK
jgi:acyl transferase domain-containing protein